jgi:hypothetical protein
MTVKGRLVLWVLVLLVLPVAALWLGVPQVVVGVYEAVRDLAGAR